MQRSRRRSSVGCREARLRGRQGPLAPNRLGPPPRSAIPPWKSSPEGGFAVDSTALSVRLVAEGWGGESLTTPHILMMVSNSISYDPRVRSEADGLSRHGYRVTLIGWDRESEFPELERTKVRRVIRLRSTPYMRLLPFDLLRLRPWWRLAFRASLKVATGDPIHAIHCHDFDTLPVGVRLKEKLKLPLVYDAHEIWGYMVARDLPYPLADFYLWKEKRLLRYVDRVITVNEALRSYFERLVSVPVDLVLNAKPVLSETYQAPQNDEFTALYIGTLSESRLVRGLVEAVAGQEGVKLILAGIGRPSYVAALKELCRTAPNVEFLGRVPQEEVLSMTRRADVVLAVFDPRDRLNRVGLPNKAFEAMASGRPVLVSEGTYLAEFTQKHGVGLVVEPSIQGIREGIKKLKDDPQLRERLGTRALEKALTEFSWERQERNLVDLYEGLLKLPRDRVQTSGPPKSS